MELNFSPPPPFDSQVSVDESFGMDESAESTEPARQFVYKGKLFVSDLNSVDLRGVEIANKPDPKKAPTPEHKARVQVG